MSIQSVQRPLPKPLEHLAELAFDLRLIGSKTMSQIWRRLDAEAWSRSNNPYMILQNADQKVLDAAAADEVLIRELNRWLERQEHYMKSPGWFGATHAQSELRGVAYFSMEFGLAEALPIYSGGLGILAGDHLKSASDLNVPVIGIGLLYQQGYFRQVLADDGWQLEAFPFNDPGSLPIRPVLDADGRWPRVGLELPGRTLILRVWNARVGKVNLYLLDSNHPLNSPWDRGITANLYAAGKEKRLLQELVLGVGGWRLLEMLGMDVQVCHLNEGHAAFAVLARAVSFAEKNKVPFQVALRATRAGNVFTTHTPVAAAFDRFEPGLLTKTAEPLVRATGLSDEAFLGLGRRDPADAGEPFNMAYLAIAAVATSTASPACTARSAGGYSKYSSPAGPRSRSPSVPSPTESIFPPGIPSRPTCWERGLRRRRTVAGQRGGGGQGHPAGHGRAALGLSRRGPQNAR